MESQRSSPPMSAQAHQVMIGATAIELFRQIDREPEDLDQIRAYIGPVLLHLFSALRYTPVTRIYTPKTLASFYIEDPKALLANAESGLLVILRNMAYPISDMIERTLSLMETADHLIEAFIKIGNFKNVHHMIGCAFECLYHWRNLYYQRAEIIKENQHLKYHLCTRSIFPLRYQVDENQNTDVHHLLKYLDVEINQETTYTLMEICGIVQLGIQEKEKGKFKFSEETKANIKKILRVEIRNLEVNNLASYLPLFASILTRPYYAECWRAANPDCQLPFLFPPRAGPLTPQAAKLNITDEWGTPTSTKPMEEQKPAEEMHLIRVKEKHKEKKSRRKLRYSPIGEKPTEGPSSSNKENVPISRPIPIFAASPKKPCQPSASQGLVPFIGLAGCHYSPISPASARSSRTITVHSSPGTETICSSPLSTKDGVDTVDSPYYNPTSPSYLPPGTRETDEIYFSDEDVFNMSGITPLEEPSSVAVEAPSSSPQPLTSPPTIWDTDHCATQ